MPNPSPRVQEEREIRFRIREDGVIVHKNYIVAYGQEPIPACDLVDVRARRRHAPLMALLFPLIVATFFVGLDTVALEVLARASKLRVWLILAALNLLAIYYVVGQIVRFVRVPQFEVRVITMGEPQGVKFYVTEHEKDSVRLEGEITQLISEHRTGT